MKHILTKIPDSIASFGTILLSFLVAFLGGSVCLGIVLPALFSHLSGEAPAHQFCHPLDAGRAPNSLICNSGTNAVQMTFGALLTPSSGDQLALEKLPLNVEPVRQAQLASR